MKRFQNIIVLNWNLQNSGALQHGITIAKQHNAALTIVDVFDSLDDTLFGQAGNGYSSSQTYWVGQQNGPHRRDMLQQIQSSGLRVECKNMSDGSYQKILDAVKQNDHDLVIVGVGDPNENMGNDTRTFMNLVRRCTVPLWIVRPSKGKPIGCNILAAVDPAPGPGPFADSENLLNKQILAVAGSLAKTGTREIHVVHCWSQPMEDRLRRSSTRTEKDIRQAISLTRRRHKRWLNLLMRSAMLEDITYRAHLLKGKPHLMIPDFARKHQLELVVLGNVSRAGVNGLFVGNTAEKILCRSDMSLLIIKPSAFFETAELRLSPSEAACALL